MRIRLGCELGYEFPAPTPMIVMLNVHYLARRRISSSPII